MTKSENSTTETAAEAAEEAEEELVELPLRGTELSEAAEEFWHEQKTRIRYQLRLIAGAKWALKGKIMAECSKEAVQVIADFEEALKEKRPFDFALEQAKHALAKLGEEVKCADYFELHQMVREKKSFEKIIEIFKPRLLRLGRWSEWRETMYLEHKEREAGTLKILKESMAARQIWSSWLSQVQGIGLALASQVIGGFESALSPGETLGTHFKTSSQMVAFAGLDVSPEGKAWKRAKGEKLRFNTTLRSVLIGRLGASFLKQKPEKSGYRRLYDEAKARLIARFNREGVEIVPSAKLPTREGKRYESEGFISEGHLHRMALRKPVKIFIHHLWEEQRKAEGLPAGKPYVIEVLGHPASSYIPPIRDKEPAA